MRDITQVLPDVPAVPERVFKLAMPSAPKNVRKRLPDLSRRGREHRLVLPGQLVAWDPSNAHTGAALNAQPWTSRLMVVEVAHLDALSTDAETDALIDVAFPEPVLSDPQLATAFLRLHTALETRTTRLERDERLAEWLHMLIERYSAVRAPRPPLTPRDDRALRLAFDYLGDRSERNVGLDELATVAGIGKFRLIRLFRDRTGLPPHALQIAHRIRKAAACWKLAKRSPRPPSPPASPTKATCIDTSNAASAQPLASTKNASAPDQSDGGLPRGSA